MEPVRDKRMYKCNGCGKQLPTLKNCWWRHYFQEIEVYCSECARSMVDERSTAGLMSADVISPGDRRQVDDIYYSR